MAKSTMKIGKAKFTKKSCHTTKTAATAAAKTVRSKGNKARVVKTAGVGYCVFAGGKSKISGTRKKK